MRAVLATRSTDKLREVREILAPLPGLELLGLDEVGIAASPLEDGIEAFDSFRENALAKARFFAARTGLPTLADDSGLVVPALGGAPGVFSKRFSGRDDLAGAQLDEANNRLLLERLRDVPPDRRDAFYVCAAAAAFPDGGVAVALGTTSGRIAAAPDGVGGFGYDPLFFVPALGVTLGRVAPDVKHRLSHRGRAFRALATRLG
ncbi:MAG TPA: non-canonical purine NTP pyrophosphatase [Longimicrobiales bacterium]|nr:non-canonical purine NTP pyrophosphatase [Longimicrobiales bacterium]